MERFVIEGGTPLNGEIEASGAKNAALPILASSVLSDEPTKLTRVPWLRDIETTCRLLSGLGVDVKRQRDEIEVLPYQLHSVEAPYNLVKTMRASVSYLGPLLARCKKARVSYPGGCAIGARPIDQHLKGLEKLGAKIKLEQGYVHAKADQLIGNRFCFDLVTVTGTMNLMMAATFAKGTTTLENAAEEPEVVDLANSLIKRGAKIEGAGKSVITIEGVDRLGGVTYEVMPDRIEAGTYLIAGAITQGKIRVKRMVPEHLRAVIERLIECGVHIEEGSDWVEASCDGRPTGIQIQTRPYPGFPTDMQAQLTALLCIANGSSMVVENIFENRFMHVSELQRMGADLRTEGRTVHIKGVEKLSGAQVMATDLRASASLVLAALRAEGVTEIQRIYHLDRGYEKMDLRLQKLGANVRRMG
jgi:UDP-N-acetylglucosamine 1-carboxyvinyltransferase